MTVLSLMAAIFLGCVHLFAGHLYMVRRVPRTWWLSFAAGTSVAYVFVHLFPEIGARQPATETPDPGGNFFKWLELKTHLVALAGLTVFYSLERFARKSRQEERQQKLSSPSRIHVFWLHVGSFAVYVAAVGYLLHSESFQSDSLALFTVALALHFLVNDHGLRELHDKAYHAHGRFVLAAAPVIGWVLAWFKLVPDHFLSIIVAFLAGGIILNVLKEELPAEREARVIPFVIGVIAYSVLLLAVD